MKTSKWLMVTPTLSSRLPRHFAVLVARNDGIFWICVAIHSGVEVDDICYGLPRRCATLAARNDSGKKWITASCAMRTSHNDGGGERDLP